MLIYIPVPIFKTCILLTGRQRDETLGPEHGVVAVKMIGRKKKGTEWRNKNDLLCHFPTNVKIYFHDLKNHNNNWISQNNNLKVYSTYEGQFFILLLIYSPIKYSLMNETNVFYNFYRHSFTY